MMEIKRVMLPGVTARNGQAIRCWLHSNDKYILVRFDVTGGGDYCLEDVLKHALTCGADDHFVMTDRCNVDGRDDIEIPSEEIKTLSKFIFSAIPGLIGKLKLSVEFEPSDPNVPF